MARRCAGGQVRMRRAAGRRAAGDRAGGRAGGRVGRGAGVRVGRGAGGQGYGAVRSAVVRT